MRVEEFKNKHSHLVNEWLSKRSVYNELGSDLPAIGFISFDDSEEPVAVGFLRQAEGSFVLVDNLITNPSAAPEIRSIAIDMVLVELIEQAKRMNVIKVLAFSVDENTITRAVGKFNCIELPHKVIALDLGRGN